MARIEFYDDPTAPDPNTLVVGVSVAIGDEQGRVLLQRRTDNGMWALPGGGMDLKESVPETAVREVREETGYDIEVTGLVGLYTDARHIIAYSDGEVRRQFNICLTGRIIGGELPGDFHPRAIAHAGRAQGVRPPPSQGREPCEEVGRGQRVRGVVTIGGRRGG